MSLQQYSSFILQGVMVAILTSILFSCQARSSAYTNSIEMNNVIAFNSANLDNSFTPDSEKSIPRPISSTTLLDVFFIPAIEIDNKTISGTPSGVRITWQRSPNLLCTGYYLYRDNNSIPDSELGNSSLRANGGNPIPQPPTGTQVVFDDIFYPLPGETWYFRVSVINDTGDESDLSNEMSITISTHDISSFFPASGMFGDNVTINGTSFGNYNQLTDEALFSTVGGSFISAEIVSWNDTEVIAVVPVGAVTGPLAISINGSINGSDTDFIVITPFIRFTNLTDGDVIRLDSEITTITSQNTQSVEFYVGSLPSPYAVDNTEPFTFNLNPKNFVNGVYQVRAVAHSQLVSFEIAVTVTLYPLIGDLNADGIVDEKDSKFIDDNFGLNSTSPGWFVYYDPNDDGILDERDNAYVGLNFGSV